MHLVALAVTFPSGTSQDELLDELEDLEGQDLDQQLTEPALPFSKVSLSGPTMPVTSAPTRLPPAQTPVVIQGTEEEEELEALKAEMAF